MNIFAHNLRLIEHSNHENHTYTLGMNHFGDWSNEEFNKLLGLTLPKTKPHKYLEVGKPHPND